MITITFVSWIMLGTQVRMPSGLRVEMNLNRPWCDVEVFLPPEYHGKTDSASMCGNSNGKSNDDFTTNLGNFRYKIIS